MSASRIGLCALAAASVLGLSACADEQGYGYGYSAGYGPAAYCDSRYYDCGDGGYGYGGYGWDDYGYYGDPWWGWYGDYFYPGIGLFVFDRFGHRFRMNHDQRHHWDGVRSHFPNRNWNQGRPNWQGFRSQGAHPTGNMGGRVGGGHASGGHRGH